MTRTVVHLMFVVSLLLLAGCVTVDSRWQDATSINTVKVYEKFLKQYPNSEHSDEAQEKIESLHWQEAIAKQSRTALGNYLRVHPNGEHAAEAKYLIEIRKKEKAKELEAKHWQEVNTKPSRHNLERYLRLHPSGEHANEAKNLIENLIWKGAKKANRLVSYESFLNKYPTSKYAAEAQASIRNFAKVHILLPDRIAPGRSYEIEFTETNGISVVFKQHHFTLVKPNGDRYIRANPYLAQSEWIHVPGNGKIVKRKHVPRDWEDGAKVIGGLYSGKDENGHKVEVTYSFEVSSK